jgi:hypothetical protein
LTLNQKKNFIHISTARINVRSLIREQRRKKERTKKRKREKQQENKRRIK